MEAIRVDAGHRKFEVATLGLVDLPELQARLEATLDLIQQAPRSKPIGVSVQSRDDGGLELSKATCLTAPQLWRWRELTLPQGEAVEAEEDWRKLALLAAACAVFGLVAWGISAAAIAPAWVAVVFYVAAMLAGGWDAFEDVREGLAQRRAGYSLPDAGRGGWRRVDWRVG